MTREQILEQVSGAMVSMFELEPSAITLDAHLYRDLDLDSIDAIDMAAQMQQWTGQRVPEACVRGMRTVGDVVDLVEQLMRED